MTNIVLIVGNLGADPVTREDQRLPSGQHLVPDWPALDLGRQLNLPRDR